MLKIIMGCDEVEKFGIENNFILLPGRYFNSEKKASWFKEKFVMDVIDKIDNADIIMDYALYSRTFDTGYSVNDLSGGAKLLILVYCSRNNIYLATMGDNCCDFLEQAALDYEKEGKDLIIVSNYLHEFNFKYIKEIEYLNWGIICHSTEEICDVIDPLWLKKWALPKDFGDDEWEDEEGMMEIEMEVKDI